MDTVVGTTTATNDLPTLTIKRVVLVISETQATLVTTKVLGQTLTEARDHPKVVTTIKADLRLATMFTIQTFTVIKSSLKKWSLWLKRCNRLLTKKSLLLPRKWCSPNFLHKLSVASRNSLKTECQQLLAIRKLVQVSSWKWWATNTDWNLVASFKFSSTS